MARSTAGLTVILASVATLGPYTIDAFFPALRAISEELGISALQAQQLLTVYMVPYATMSLLHGSLSDALGRRPVVIGALTVYLLASIGCAFAPGFATLALFRGLQGMVAGSGHIVGRAIVRDRYHGVQAQKVMSSITMLFALGPALAPVIGGWVYVWFGWRAVFGTMALIGVLLLLVMLRWLPETHPADKRSELHVGALTRATLEVMRHRRFQWLTASSCLCFIALHAYLGSAPAIILDHWGLDETGFWALSVPIIGGYALGAWFSGRMAGRVAPERLTHTGFHLLLATSFAMLVLQWQLRDAPILAQQLLLATTAFGLQLMFPVITLQILDLFPHARGTAASAHAFFAMMMSALVMGLIAPWLSMTMLRLAISGFCVTLAGWVLWYTKVRGNHPGD